MLKVSYIQIPLNSRVAKYAFNDRVAIGLYDRCIFDILHAVQWESLQSLAWWFPTTKRVF